MGVTGMPSETPILPDLDRVPSPEYVPPVAQAGAPPVTFCTLERETSVASEAEHVQYSASVVSCRPTSVAGPMRTDRSRASRFDRQCSGFTMGPRRSTRGHIIAEILQDNEDLHSRLSELERENAFLKRGADKADELEARLAELERLKVEKDKERKNSDASPKSFG